MAAIRSESGQEANETTGEVIFILSDSDEEPTKPSAKNSQQTHYKFLFDEFVTCSNNLLTKIRDKATTEKIRKHLIKGFKAAREDYLSSEEFTNTVRQHLGELQKPDIKDQAIFSVVHDVVIHLKNASNKPKKSKENKTGVGDSGKHEDKLLSNGGIETDDAKTAGTDPRTNGPDESDPQGTKDVNSGILSGDIKKEVVSTRRDVDPGNIAGGSSEVAKFNDANKSSNTSVLEKPSCSKDKSEEEEKGDEDKGKKRKIRRMEKLMGRLNREIRRYSEKELSLEEMGRDDSSHMIEHKLRKRFVEAWQKWCKLKGYEAKTGRGVEKKVNFKGTRYPEINKRICKLVKGNKFPDFHDVYHVIRKTNTRDKLGIHEFDLRPLATEVFKDVGEMLSKRRINDYMCNAGYASFFDAPDDPANENPELRTRLEDNAIKGREMMDSVLEKYTLKAREVHKPGVEPEFDRTSEPEVAPDESEDDFEDGDWVEYVSDSDESQSESGAVKSPEMESKGMETCPDKADENQIEGSKKRPIERESLSDDNSKKVKLSSNDAEKTDVISNGTPQSNTEVKVAHVSKAPETMHPQGNVKAETVKPFPSKPHFDPTKNGIPSTSSCQVRLVKTNPVQLCNHKINTLQAFQNSSSKPESANSSIPTTGTSLIKPVKTQPVQLCTSRSKPAPNQPQPVSFASGSKTLACSSNNIVRTQVRKIAIPVAEVKQEIAIIKRAPVDVGSSRSASLSNNGPPRRKIAIPVAEVKQELTINTRAPVGEGSSRSASLSNNGPSRRIQLTSLDSRSQLISLSRSLPPSKVHTNGTVVTPTRIDLPVRKTNAAISATQKVGPSLSRSISVKTQNKQSNGPKAIYKEDEDGCIVIE
ncbi:death domain-associated protein 6-like [Lytechinus variegatus]|uniref:death domain-associated protein 6-like n=1 Tax=Lytechinus variegatus TaxID=7654 RepID=UPI001BB11145|nr:death domain-associated protein 6-like [Lytechinus variegatus]